VIIGALVVGWILLQISYKASAGSRHKRPGCIRAALGFVALFVLIYAILFTVQRWESAGSPLPLPERSRIAIAWKLNKRGVRKDRRPGIMSPSLGYPR
jgi:hypothetical protein